MSHLFLTNMYVRFWHLSLLLHRFWSRSRL